MVGYLILLTPQDVGGACRITKNCGAVRSAFPELELVRFEAECVAWPFPRSDPAELRMTKIKIVTCAKRDSDPGGAERMQHPPK